MPRPARLVDSTIGKKAIMAVTGLMLFGFVLGHMAGNLKVFLGAESMNAYGAFLREMGYPLFPHSGLLWIARIGLLAAVGAHVWAYVGLFLRNKEARPERYRHRAHGAPSALSRTMRVTGPVLLAYVLVHLAHLTWGWSWVHPSFEHGKPYENLVTGFAGHPLMVAWYMVGMVALALHLYHGLWSLFQSLGLNHPMYNPWRRAFAIGLSAIVSLGFIAVPAAIVVGIVH